MKPIQKAKKIFGEIKLLKLTLHPLFLILGVVLFLMGEFSVFIICSLSALLHEYGHFIVAERLGYKMHKIRLMPFGAELFGDLDSFDNKDELLIAICGPIVNVLIVLLLLGLWWLKPELYNFTYEIFSVNLVMGIFNLLPIFPLDGGRVVLCFLSSRMERRKAASIVKSVTKVFSVILFVAFLLTIKSKINLSFGIMAFMLYFTASSSMKDATYQKVQLEKLVQSKFVEWAMVSVPEKTKLYELRKKHIKNKVILFLVINSQGKISYSFSELELNEKLQSVPQTTNLVKLKNLLYDNNNKSFNIIDKSQKICYNP